MSETWKIFTSLSGAILAHLLILLFVFVLLSTGKLVPPVPEPEMGGEAAPREVTIRLGELLDRVEPLPEPEPEIAEKSEPDAEEPPPEPEEEQARPFMETELNAPEAEAPDDAKFESDRNTSAAAELAPDPDLPQREGPTTVGNLPVDRLTLQKREYVDGELDQPAAPPGVNVSAEAPEILADQPPGGGFPASPPAPPRPADTPRVPGEEAEPAEEPSEEAAAASKPPAPESETEPGEADEFQEGAETPPEEEIAEEKTRPEASETDGPDEETRVRKSFLVPGGENGLPAEAEEGPEDAFAAARPESDAPEGEARDREREQKARIGGDGDDPEAEETEEAPPPPREESISSEATEPAETPGMNPADVGLFADGFSPEQMQDTANGTLTNLGQNAVDAESTEVGKYKNEIRKAIAKKWHEYRVRNAEHVSWGILKLRCRVDRNGGVHDLEIVENEANTMLADFSLRAILDADLPPMPPDVAEELGAGGLQLNYDIIIY